jgi:hypothetical protein
VRCGPGPPEQLADAVRPWTGWREEFHDELVENDGKEKESGGGGRERKLVKVARCGAPSTCCLSRSGIRRGIRARERRGAKLEPETDGSAMRSDDSVAVTPAPALFIYFSVGRAMATGGVDRAGISSLDPGPGYQVQVVVSDAADHLTPDVNVCLTLHRLHVDVLRGLVGVGISLSTALRRKLTDGVWRISWVNLIPTGRC